MPAGTTTVSSPINGVDYYSPLFGMPPESAIRLTNWWPEVYGNTHRRGYEVWSDDLPGIAGYLSAYHTRSGSSYLHVVCGDGKMYDITARDTVTPAPARTPVVSGLSTNVWNGAMFSNSAGTHKVLVSGQDNPIWMHQPAPPAIGYDRLTAGNGTDPGTIRGVSGQTPDLVVLTLDPSHFIDVMIHQKRLWFVEKGTTYGWYLPPEQVFGDARRFDFGPLFKRGGYLQSLATWTVDDGEGADDLLVAFGSMGDVAVYKGIDPNGADTWALQGVYYAGAPIEGHRFHAKVSGDLKFMTIQGLVSMNDMLTSSRVVAPQNTVEAKPVQQFLSQQATLYGFLSGWDIQFVPSINMLIINVPSVVDGSNLQVCENVVNSRWTTFLGMDADCWCPDFQEVPFFTMGTSVCKAWTGHLDGVSLKNPKGTPIIALVQQAYNNFGSPAVNKQVGIYRPNFLTSTSVAWKAAISYNYKVVDPSGTLTADNPLSYVWDTAIWDSSMWTGGLHLQNQWASAQGYGFTASLSMATRSSGEVIWASTDFTIITGGVL